MKFKLLACDIDGTLLTSKHTLTERTIEVIQKAKEKGVLVTLATGRDFGSAKHVAKSLGIDIPLVTNDGTYLVEPCGTKVIYESRIDRESSVQLISLLNDLKLSYIIQDEPNSYRNNRFMFLKMIGSFDFFRFMAFRKQMGHHKTLKSKSILEGVSINKIRPFKVCVFSDDFELKKEVAQKIKEEFRGILRVSSSGFHGIEIVQDGFSKAKGLDVLCERYDIETSEVIAIGDGFNDLEMVDFAGLGIAMGNATDELKEKAGYVTRTNDEDGVAYAIERFVLD